MVQKKGALFIGYGGGVIPPVRTEYPSPPFTNELNNHYVAVGENQT